GAPAQLALAHSKSPWHGCPLSSLQLPLPLHEFAPLHEVSSRPIRMLPQVPLATPVSMLEHALHVPVHAPLQQKPSTQLPLSHVLGSLHGWPTRPRQLPMPLQEEPGHWSFGSCPWGTLVRLHVLAL